MKTKFFLMMGLVALILGSSCVSQKKYKSQVSSFEALNDQYTKKQSDLNACETAKANYLKQIEDLNKQLADLSKEQSYLKTNNSVVLNQLEALSVISSTQAESIKKSMDNLGMKDAYIQGLQTSLAQKDSLNLALVMNLKGAVGSMDDKDINIKVDKGVVFIDISDKLLFKSGSYEVTDKANEVLGKVAKVLKNQPNMDFMVEGHTDNVPFKKGDLIDNWDLSVKRSTTIVRLLQTKYGLDPASIIAAGRSEYQPVTSNSSADGKAANRRTRIVILPQLDQFFKLLEKK
ncbi:MAG: OmpA family protein [Bacteroidales bacterium]|nr:OmpA family protein [Bacteroidales bacterium]